MGKHMTVESLSSHKIQILPFKENLFKINRKKKNKVRAIILFCKEAGLASKVSG